MQIMAKTTKKKATGKESEHFTWTDDEVELLLKVTNEFKVKKAASNIDWESVQSKYSDITNELKEQLPSTPEERGAANTMGKDYPHKPGDITKIIVTTKLKAIRTKYRQAVDNGRRSGHGRVVLLFFELCEQIWGGSPATATIPCGIESGEIQAEEQELPQDSDTASVSLSPDTGDAIGGDPNSPEFEGGEESSDLSDRPSTSTTSSSLKGNSTKERRELLNSKLSNYKQEKLKRKLPVDSQLLSIAQEDSKMKKQMLEQMEGMDKEYCNSMKSLSQNIEKLTESITSGFALFSQVLMEQSHTQSSVPMPHAQSSVPMPYQPQYQTGYYAPNQNMSDTLPPSSSQQFSYSHDDHW